ncbi:MULTISPECIES: hypothetical protein [unclassified Paenibacillus]|uniref:hypothetical protein n=1 Tax=unclassified Paenibacillus TaxID=185978 RepID=UPI002379718F|nr:hypothetical protein [Paenibacillus sp. MAHUQ-63]
MHSRYTSHASKRQVHAGSAHVQMKAPNPVYSSVMQLQRTIGNRAVQQLVAGSSVIQMLAWPSKKPQQSKISQTLADHWGELDTSDVKEFYAWCTTTDQFEHIPTALSHSEWKTLKASCTGAKFDEHGFASDTSKGNIRSIFQFATAKKAAPYKRYDEGTYMQTNDQLASDIAAIQTEGTFNLDRIIALDKSLAFDLVEADKERHAAKWEKENNADLAKEKSMELNQKIKAAKEKMQTTLALLASAHMTKLTEEKEAAKKKAKVDGAILAAENAYAITSSSALTRAIWNSTKANAGLTGYLELSGSYTAGDLQTAHDEWRDFGYAYDQYAGKVDFLDNIHSPGNGTAQDKLTHSNYESRSCRYQVDFISNWGGNRTVMHVGLQGTEKK